MVLDNLKSTPLFFWYPAGLGYQQFHFLITMKEILAIRVTGLWCALGFVLAL